MWFPAAANKQVGRNVTVWLADDVRRRPVRLQACSAVGSHVVALREAR